MRKATGERQKDKINHNETEESNLDSGLLNGPYSFCMAGDEFKAVQFSKRIRNFDSETPYESEDEPGDKESTVVIVTMITLIILMCIY